MSNRLPYLANHVNTVVYNRLQHEWRAISQRPEVLHRAQGWGLGITFVTLDEVVAATGYWCSEQARLRARSGQATDVLAVGAGNEVLRRLLVASHTDVVAARVVLQRLLPGLVTRARRWGDHRPGGSPEAFDELLSAAWTVIREFPVERRPRHLAANLLRDSEHRAFTRAARRSLVQESTEPDLLDRAAEPAPVEPLHELAEVVATARSLTDGDRKLLGMLVRGCTAAEVAVLLEVSERTVRNQREAMVHRLRSAALAELAA
ncbi:MAG: LuxR C-terminal-related transcriptional regulator [Actinomycetota bacterium]|nr:LuxR C-terminal-related transcriptional regulator [Actinomycetota bacterium]